MDHDSTTGGERVIKAAIDYITMLESKQLALWQPIETAPKGRLYEPGNSKPIYEKGPLVDIYAKCWRPDTDTFEYKYFPASQYGYSMDGHGGWNIAGEWRPCFWRAIGDPFAEEMK